MTWKREFQTPRACVYSALAMALLTVVGCSSSNVIGPEDFGLNFSYEKTIFDANTHDAGVQVEGQEGKVLVQGRGFLPCSNYNVTATVTKTDSRLELVVEWEGDDVCADALARYDYTAIVTGLDAAQYEVSVIQPVLLGDGGWEPRAIGEATVSVE